MLIKKRSYIFCQYHTINLYHICAYCPENLPCNCKKPIGSRRFGFGRTNFTDNYQVFYEYLIERQKKLNQFKAQAGVLGGKLQTELDFVNQALELYKDAE